MAAGFVDIHHHLLHGIDDGPGSYEETVEMLTRAVKQGVRHVAATPHMQPGLVEFDEELYRKRLDAAREYVRENDLPIRIWSGAEVFYTTLTPVFLQQGRIPTLGESWNVLVEFDPEDSYETILRGADAIGNAGYTMVLAHAERYRALRWGDRLARLKEENPVVVQMNATSVLRDHEGWRNRWIRRMFSEGVVDVIATDAHNISTRACTMGKCAKEISRLYGEEMARLLCVVNPRSVLQEERR